MPRKTFIVFFAVVLSTCIAQYEPVISSSWSMWSPWSFCSNNVMIRVRACSTVRGYKCIGHNKEFQSCSSPPKRTNMDYEDPEAADRDMAMKQLYQDYEPEIPEEEKYSPSTRPNNNNFHLIGTTSTQPPIPTVRGTTENFDVPKNEKEEEYSNESDEIIVNPTNIPEVSTHQQTFEFDKYPSPTTSIQTEKPEDMTEMSSSPTEEPTTTPITSTISTSTIETTSLEQVTETPIPDNEESATEITLDNIQFTGNYKLEEPIPSLSLPTTIESMPPGPEITSHPTSFPISEEEPTENEFLESTNSRGSFAIGKEPEFDDELETNVLQSVTPKMPTFTVSSSKFPKNIGDVRRAPEIQPTEPMITSFEIPSAVLPELREVISEEPTESTTVPTTTTTTTSIPSTTIIGRPIVQQNPVIALVTSHQNMQTFPKLMNEQRAPPKRIAAKPQYITMIANPSEPTNEPQLTVEITKKPLKKKKKKVRRLKKLNRMARKRVISVLPNENTAEVNNEKNEQQPSDKYLVPKSKVNNSEIPQWATQKDRQVIEETKELEARLIALQHRVDMNKKLLENMKSSSVAPKQVKEEEVVVQGDTARALSWMINDMERMVDDKTQTFVADTLPIEKVDERNEGFRIGEAEDIPTTTESPFPFPTEQGFSLIRSKRSSNRSKVLWSPWSEWTHCNCGKQSRKRKCFKNIGENVNKNQYDNYKFIPIKSDNTVIEFGESAPFPESVKEPEPIDSNEQENIGSNRVKRSLKCPPPQIEVRYCTSRVCIN